MPYRGKYVNGRGNPHRLALIEKSFAALRRRLPFDRHELRPMTAEKQAQIIELYDRAVRELYGGLA